jgi:hypothetical protein
MSREMSEGGCEPGRVAKILMNFSSRSITSGSKTSRSLTWRQNSYGSPGTPVHTQTILGLNLSLKADLTGLDMSVIHPNGLHIESFNFLSKEL